MLRDRAGEVSALLTNSFSSIESSMQVLGSVGASHHPAATRMFKETATPLVQRGTTTVGVAEERENGFRVVAGVGDGPVAGASLVGDRAVLATRALAAGKLVSTLVADERGTRLILAMPVASSRSVIYQESVLDPTTPWLLQPPCRLAAPPR